MIIKSRYGLLLPIILFLISSIVTGCAQIKLSEPDSAQIELALTASQHQIQGEYLEAVAIYDKLASLTEPPNDLNWRLNAISALLYANLLQDAEERLSDIPSNISNVNLNEQRRLLLARLANLKGDPKTALATLGNAPPISSNKLIGDWFEQKARALSLSGKPLASVRSRIQLNGLLPDASARKANDEALWTTLSTLPASELTPLAGGPAIYNGWIELATIAALSGSITLEESIAMWRLRYPNHPADQNIVVILLDRASGRAPMPEHIALVLPVTGRYSAVAIAVRDGLMAAYYDYMQRASNPVSLRIYNMGDEPLSAWTVYQQAVSDGADFVIGPLAKEAVSTLEQSGTLEIPVLALNTSGNDGNPTENMYQFSLDPETEAFQVAERMALDGHSTALIVSPDSSWGVRLANAFQTRFEQLGGRVLSSYAMSDKTSGYSSGIGKLLMVDRSKKRYRLLKSVLRKDLKFESRRRQDVDAIFLASFAAQARQILPFFGFHRAGDISVYATSHIYTGMPDAAADRDLNNALFCDTPWTLSGTQTIQIEKNRLASLWPAGFSRYPRLYSLGIDAFRLLGWLDWLNAHPADWYNGTTGRIRMENRKLTRQLLWARFENGLPKILGQELPLPLNQTPIQ